MKIQSVKNLTLITGGVRSGKSLFAESLAHQYPGAVHYLATMPHLPGDEEQRQRIDRHRGRRPDHWQTVESPYRLDQTINALPNVDSFCILDCLSVYVSNLIIGEKQEGMVVDPYQREAAVLAQVDTVLAAIRSKHQIEFVVVTNEVGWGIVPESALGRAFRDALGIANQKFAQEADVVFLTCLGLRVQLKPAAVLAVSAAN